MAKKSDSRGKDRDSFEDVASKVRAGAAPALAKALNLDSAEAVESAMNAAIEIALAARAFVRSLPLPPEAREHLDRAEREAIRATKLAVKGIEGAGRARKTGGGLRKVTVEFRKDHSETRRGPARRK